MLPGPKYKKSFPREENLLALPLDMGVIVMPLAMDVSGRLSGKELISLGARGRSLPPPPAGGVRPLPAPGARIVMGGGTKTVLT
jgi:hypothetical protein